MNHAHINDSFFSDLEAAIDGQEVQGEQDYEESDVDRMMAAIEAKQQASAPYAYKPWIR